MSLTFWKTKNRGNLTWEGANGMCNIYNSIDRVEALAGAIVGSLNNILTGHIEGGEVFGTINKRIRHAVTKMPHVHFVANKAAKQRFIQLGEREDSVHVIGAPDIDVMNSSVPGLSEVRSHYQISFPNYGVLAFHSVTTVADNLRSRQAFCLDALEKSNRNFVVIYPNAGSNMKRAREIV